MSIIDWENPFDVIRSAEIDGSITLFFKDNGTKNSRVDDKGKSYTQYSFECIRTDITNPAEILFTTSSSRLIDAMTAFAPIKEKELKVIRTGTGYGTQYSVEEVKGKKK